ncbi:hypothetical protein ACIF9R_02975 [Streptomyces sp. NPDC086080]
MATEGAHSWIPPALSDLNGTFGKARGRDTEVVQESTGQSVGAPAR